MKNKDLISIAIGFSPVVLGVAVALLNAQSETCQLGRDWNFNGDTLIVERCVGQLGLATETRVVGKVRP